MKKTAYAIDPAFKKMPSVTIANKRWLLRFLSTLISSTRLFYRCSDAVITTTHTVRGSDNNSVEIIEITPKTLQDKSKAPAIVYYHGGGFFFSYGRLHLKQVETYAEQLQARVFFVRYRLSTEQCFPGPLTDCVSALDWVYDNAEDLKVDRDRIAVMGDSAGGCLAASVTQHVADDNQQRQKPNIIRAQFLIYPALDSDCKTVSAQTFDDTPVWNATNNKIMWQVYLGEGKNPLHPPAYASPAHRESLTGLPAAYIESAEFDPLRDEAHNYADALEAAGVEVQRELVKGAVHGYDSVDCEVTQVAKAKRLACMKAMLCD